MGFKKWLEAMPALARCRGSKEAFVLAILADEHRDDTGICNPKIDLLVARTHYSRSAVQRALDNLEADQFVRIVREYGARFRFVLTLDPQLHLRVLGPRRKKRATGFARPGVAARAQAASRGKGRRSGSNPCQGDMGFAGAAPVDEGSNPTHGVIGSPVENSADPTHGELGLPILGDQHKADNPTHRVIATQLTVRSQDQDQGTSGRTATAPPRLPFPIAMKPARPVSETASLAADLRLRLLRRRVAGYAIGVCIDPVRQGEALVLEPVTSLVLLIAATSELCRRRKVDGYAEVVDAMCASVWWRRSSIGQEVIKGRAPRPRDLAKQRARR